MDQQELSDLLFKIKAQQQLIKEAQNDIRELDKELFAIQAQLYTHSIKKTNETNS